MDGRGGGLGKEQARGSRSWVGLLAARESRRLRLGLVAACCFVGRLGEYGPLDGRYVNELDQVPACDPRQARLCDQTGWRRFMV
jgi:hypothetical protein